MATAEFVTREQLLENRREILEKVKLSEEDFRKYAENYQLRGNEQELFEAFEAIDWLLGK